MSHSLNRVQWLESRKGGFLPDQTRLVWQELERRRGCLPRPRSSKSKEAKHSNNVFNTAVNFHLCLVNILQGFTWNVSWYGMPAQWGKRYSEFLIFDWCLKLCSLVWWLGCQASQHGKTDQFWSSHSFHVFFSPKKLNGVMYIFLQGFDGDFFIVYFLQVLAVKIKRSLQGWPVGENT